MIRREGVARRKGNVRKNETRDNVVQGNLRGRTLGRRHQPKPECKIGMKDPGTRQQLHLKIERISDGFDRKAFRLEFVKQAAGMSSGLQKVRD
jgi:hypothetical protein